MAGGRDKINEHELANTNGFDKRPWDAGRKPKLVSDVIKQLKDEGYEPVTASQIADAYQLMINLDESQMQKKLLDKDCPVLFRIVIKSMLTGKGFEIVERMIDRAHGKAMEQKKETVTHRIELSEGDAKQISDELDTQY